MRVWFLCAALLGLPVEGGNGYLVLVDPGPGEEYLEAAREMAALHQAEVKRFDPARLEELLAGLRRAPPRFVVFVLPPEKIDVDLCHAILELSTKVDEDPFPDFEYGFITGRDGPAASRFVARIAAAWKREFGRKGAMLGTWGSAFLPLFRAMTATRALGLDFKPYLVSTKAGEEARRERTRAALASMEGLDLLFFFSHGYPDQMVGCFRAQDLREWKVDLAPAVLFNCACYNGAPGRWYAPGPAGVEDQGVISRQDSVALALLDSGVSAYFAGVDPWHGPLTNQVFCYVADDGLRLGQAAKRMADRLALDFLPRRIHFPRTLENPRRFSGEGSENRRHNGAGMIFYGDPALAPFERTAKRSLFAELEPLAGGLTRVRVGARPFLPPGFPGVDFMVAESRLADYYSVKTEDFTKELTAEIYRVIPLPARSGGAPPRLRVVSARAGEREIPAGEPQLAVETAAEGKLLHLRVPLALRLVGTDWAEKLARSGVTIVLEGEL